MSQLQYRDAAYDPAKFEPTGGPKSRKIRCIVCGFEGHPNVEFRWGDDQPWEAYQPWWGFTHSKHPWECSTCDMKFTSPQGLSAHRRSRHAKPRV